MPRCRKILGNGKRCKAKAISGSRYCVFHTKRKPPYNGGKGRKQKSSSGSDSSMNDIAKRRAIVMSHQVTGRIATAAGTAMLASAASPVKARTYTMLKASEVRGKGITVNKKTTVYRPETERDRPQRRHQRRYYGDRVTKGPKAGKILRGDELRYYGRQRTKAAVGSGMVAYGRSSKAIGYAHAYKPTLRWSPWDFIMYANDPSQMGRDVRDMGRQMDKNTKRNIGRAVTLGTAIGAQGGFEGIRTTIGIEVIKSLLS
jgi:hypothetical protein